MHTFTPSHVTSYETRRLFFVRRHGNFPRGVVPEHLGIGGPGALRRKDLIGRRETRRAGQTWRWVVVVFAVIIVLLSGICLQNLAKAPEQVGTQPQQANVDLPRRRAYATQYVCGEIRRQADRLAVAK